MEFRDPIHNEIFLYPEEISIVSHPFFQRLKRIKQLGTTEHVFPGATHSRFLHSLGVLAVSTMSFQRLFGPPQEFDSLEKKRLFFTLRMAALLHDLGHAPLSHVCEAAMPFITRKNQETSRATHEDYTRRAILESDLSQEFSSLTKKYGVQASAIASLIEGDLLSESLQGYFLWKGKDFFPLLSQLVSSELDCDRMDYLLRDSYFCGVSYGKFDLSWLLENIRPLERDNKIYLGIEERALISIDDFLLARYHMFLMVYFHYKSVCLEQLLLKFFSVSDFLLPWDLTSYFQEDDYTLQKQIQNSDNIYAKSFREMSLPPKIMEIFGPKKEGKELFSLVESFLKNEGVEYLKSSSAGRLSKYTSIPEKKFPIFVQHTNGLTKSTSFSLLEDATDLFKKYKESYYIERLHAFLTPSLEKKLKSFYAKNT